MSDENLGCFNVGCQLKENCARAAKTLTDSRFSKIAVFHPKRDRHKQQGKIFCINFKSKRTAQ